MAFTESLAPFIADFGISSTLAGVPLTAIVDSESVVELDGVVTQVPSALVMTSDAVSAAPGQVFVANSTTYKVRRVVREPPDGVFTSLVLTR